ncbi:MAG: S-adenosyl-l-methionine hydroxide adenosyltransferase family protein [Bdellovibrio bacteriovorus]
MDPTGIARLALVTDFGSGVYLGQMRARLSTLVPDLPVIDLVHDLAPFRADLAAYLLPALMRDMPSGTLYLCVVDPGVGGERAGLLVKTGGDWLLAPDNGLLARVSLRDRAVQAWRIGWLPQDLSASFHGRDWFAPAAARLCLGEDLGLSPLDAVDLVGADWPDALPAVVYADRYGNLMCGLLAATLPAQARIRAAGRVLERARTFCEVPPGEPFWYENALGLVELAVNQGRAQDLLGLAPGDGIELLEKAEPEVAHV